MKTRQNLMRIIKPSLKILYSFVLLIVSISMYAYPLAETKYSQDNEWKKIVVSSSFLDEIMPFFIQELKNDSAYLSPSFVRLFEHCCSTDSIQFCFYRIPLVADPEFYHIYIKKGEDAVDNISFEELTDCVFNTFLEQQASSALSIIKAYATMPLLYNYYHSEALERHETDAFKSIRSAFSNYLSHDTKSEYNLCPPVKGRCHILRPSLIEDKTWIEPWQYYSYGKSCEYNLNSIYFNKALNVELLQSEVGNKIAYALVFMSSKPTILELNNSQSFFSEEGKTKYYENLTYLAILMEVIDSPYIDTDREKYQLIQIIRYLRKIIGVQGRYIPQENRSVLGL